MKSKEPIFLKVPIKFGYTDIAVCQSGASIFTIVHKLNITKVIITDGKPLNYYSYYPLGDSRKVIEAPENKLMTMDEYRALLEEIERGE